MALGASALGWGTSAEGQQRLAGALGSLQEALGVANGVVHGRTGSHPAGCGCAQCTGRSRARGDDDDDLQTETTTETQSEQSTTTTTTESATDNAPSESGPATESESSEASGKTSKTPPPPTLTSETIAAAPGGAAKTRTDIGVGEKVKLTSTIAGTWTATAGTLPAPASGTTVEWKAPATAGSITITLTTAAGATGTLALTVVAPSGISMVNGGGHSLTAGTAGACMLTNVTITPLNVSLGAIQWLEVPGPATNISGYFAKFSAATLHHNPNPDYVPIEDNNTLAGHDHAAWHAVTGPYKAGTFEWSVPNKYIIDGEGAGAGRLFTTTLQAFSMAPDGTMTITKAGASVSRAP